MLCIMRISQAPLRRAESQRQRAEGEGTNTAPNPESPPRPRSGALFCCDLRRRWSSPSCPHRLPFRLVSRGPQQLLQKPRRVPQAHSESCTPTGKPAWTLREAVPVSFPDRASVRSGLGPYVLSTISQCTSTRFGVLFCFTQGEYLANISNKNLLSEHSGQAC